ncbi:MAG: hypothetical protein L6V93_22960 [Clostridiales bacterium]|nr:MAG: hypothetical protein L6V93_22960 [Clostridiales bacterium]
MSTTAGEYGEWHKAGPATSSANALKAKLTAVDAPEISLVDGENTLFVQTALCYEGTESKIELISVKTD